MPAEWKTGFSQPQIIEVHELLLALKQKARLAEREAAKAGQGGAYAATYTELQVIHREFNAEVRQEARRSARIATKAIRDRIRATKKRRARVTGQLVDAIECRAYAPIGQLESGFVGVANVPKLDRETINLLAQTAKGRAPYWRAQEEGTRKHIGRHIFGMFGTIGGPVEPPQSGYGRYGPHPVFYALGTGRGPAKVDGRDGPGGFGGRGEIRNEIEGRHFIRDGARVAGAEYVDRMAQVQGRLISRLDATVGAHRPVAPRGARRRGPGPRRR